MREATCKDCLREERAQTLGVAVHDLPDDFAKEFVYNERAAAIKIERGQTRSDRCQRHRARHRINVQGMAVPYIDLKTIGEAIGARDEDGPTGPFGGLGPMPEAHRIAEATQYDLSEANVGMTDDDILAMLVKLKTKRVLVAKAGTGTGKSTFMPYRLLDPPAGAPFDLAGLGSIIVTEPRVQATTGVAWYVGAILSGAGGVGPGYPVGFQVKGTKAHDDSCQLIYVTDGTMINWLREGRLSTIGTVIVDEAHERSTNIDLILGYLKAAIDRYPHLRVIITSATFDERFYQEYFGGPDRAAIHVVDAVKTIGYGFPLFPDLDSASPSATDLTEPWRAAVGADLPLRPVQDPADEEFVARHFEPRAPALKEADVASDYPDRATGVGWEEPLHDTTRELVALRFQPERYDVPGSIDEWKRGWAKIAPRVLGEYVVDLVKGLEAAAIYGDVLAFLPTTAAIGDAVAIIKEGLGVRGEHGEHGDPVRVYPLISSLPTDIKEKALLAQVKGDPRKIVVSTNLAETSLTVEGVRFVVDSGLIAQEEWDPETAQGGVQTSRHSQAGVRQRWGRVGRKSPGWAFPLYTKEQFLTLAPDTAPGSTRSNLEDLIMTAKLGGVDDVVAFDWPAKFWPSTWPQTPDLDPDDDGIRDTPYVTAARARRTFLEELRRADVALRHAGAVDGTGDPTALGKDLARAPSLGSEASKIALMHADRLACVPEVATILKLLDNTSLIRHNGLLLDSPDWPAEWRLEAAERHKALASACCDDAELALQVMAVWERADPDANPAWEQSAAREEWCRRWWVNHDLLLDAAEARHEVLVALSPAMKEDVKRFVEPALVQRARGAITRAFAAFEYTRDGGDTYASLARRGGAALYGVIDGASLFPRPGRRIIPLKRNKPEGRRDVFLSNIVTVEEWALPDASDAHRDGSVGLGGSLDLVLGASRSARPDPRRSVLAQLQALWPSGLRVRLALDRVGDDLFVAGDPIASVPSASMPAPATKEVVDEQKSGLAEEEAVDAAEADANPQDDTTWPSPVEPVPDEVDTEIELELRALADHVDLLSACRECDACLSGRLDQCETPLAPVQPVSDDVEEWHRMAWRNAAVAHPRVEGVDATTFDDGWYEVVGHQVDDVGPVLRLRPSWRQDGEQHRPGTHDDLTDGAEVALEVGGEHDGHRGTRFRTFYRRDQGRRIGRFVLRASSGSDHLACGGELEGHVTERPAGDAVTLTFVPRDRGLGLRLDMPRLSVDEARSRYEIGSVAEMVVTGIQDSGGSAWLETRDGTGARVTKDAAGESGIFDLRAVLRVGAEVLAVVQDVTEFKGRVQLQVALPDVSAPTVDEVEARHPPGTPLTMRVTGIAPDGGRAWLVTKDGLGAMAGRKDAGEAGVADLSAALTPGDDVEARVLSVGEYQGKIQITVALPSLSGPTLGEAVAGAYEVGKLASFTVTRILPDGRRAFLKSSSGVSATLTAGHVGRGGVLHLSSVLAPGQVIDATVVGIGEHHGEPQLTLGLRHIEVPSLGQQLAALRVAPGEIHDGVVTHVADFGIFVAVGPVSGLVHKTKLSGGSTDAYPKGTPLRVSVLIAGEDPRKPGTPKIGFALA